MTFTFARQIYPRIVYIVYLSQMRNRPSSSQGTHLLHFEIYHIIENP